ncbi:MAG: PEP-CTERM sorting domain-containing protein, partial [Phycisphaerales bacterium]|nr:PEP-CTERM sorting domain-containing protein [Phycisphaerales bacterium]
GNGGQDGRALALNDMGEFVVSLDLGTYTTATSGAGTSSITYSGLFVFKGIPAPGASVLLGLGGLLAARRRRN